MRMNSLSPPRPVALPVMSCGGGVTSSSVVVNVSAVVARVNVPREAGLSGPPPPPPAQPDNNAVGFAQAKGGSSAAQNR